MRAKFYSLVVYLNMMSLSLNQKIKNKIRIFLLLNVNYYFYFRINNDSEERIEKDNIWNIWKLH